MIPTKAKVRYTRYLLNGYFYAFDLCFIMLGGLVKTGAVVGIGAVAAKWADLSPSSSTIMMISLGTVGAAVTVLTRGKILKPEGRAVFITGCDSGFGHALAKELDKQGMRVFAGCLFADGPGAQEIKKTCSERLEILQLDISQDEQVKKAASEVKRKLNGEELWGLVNNAGTMSFSDVEVTPIQEWQRLFDVNCLGQVRMIQAFLPMLRRSQGRVVNVASTHGRSFLPMFGAYCASKAGVVMYSECLRLELMKWGMNVSIIEPSAFATDLVVNSDRQKAFFRGVNSKLTEDQKLFYNKQYFDTVIQRFYFPNTSNKKHLSECLPTDLTPVVSSITHALLSTKPREHYVTGRGGGILIALGCYFPYFISNRIMLNIKLNKSKDLQPTVEEVYDHKSPTPLSRIALQK